MWYQNEKFNNLKKLNNHVIISLHILKHIYM